MSPAHQWALAALFISGMTVSITPCACGHLPAAALWGTVPGAVIAWVSFFRNKGQALGPRLLVWGTTVFASFMLLKNIHSVLWSGHHALLG